MGGPIVPSDLTISTSALNRVLCYEPKDLTIKVEAGMPYRELTALLAREGQMLPLDPPFAEDATIGGVLATNQSGPRRRLYGSARDMAIGMTFATVEGKLVQTGGMVVKNVAGLDMAKMLIGSFGTLAAIATVNFKVSPIPPSTRSFQREFATSSQAIDARDTILNSVLQPSAIDLQRTLKGYRLLLQAGGNQAVLNRYSRELEGFEALENEVEQALWTEIREFTPQFLRTNPNGVVSRYSCQLSRVGAVLQELPAPSIARAASGVAYGYHTSPEAAESLNLPGRVIEFAPQAFREKSTLWPSPGTDFGMMEKVKLMFDPGRLLNQRRLYGRI